MLPNGKKFVKLLVIKRIVNEWANPFTLNKGKLHVQLKYYKLSIITTLIKELLRRTKMF